jgi:hypothetical protein
MPRVRDADGGGIGEGEGKAMTPAERKKARIGDFFKHELMGWPRGTDERGASGEGKR